MSTGFILIEVPTERGPAWLRPDAVTSIRQPVRYNGFHLEDIDGATVSLGDDTVFTALTVAEVVELLRLDAGAHPEWAS